MTWKKDVLAAMLNLNKNSHLDEIYNEVSKIRNITSKEWKAQVRATLERNSSDSDAWEGKDDLFKMIDKGSGIWGLNEKVKKQEEASSLGIKNYWWGRDEIYWMEVTNRDKSQEISAQRGSIGENIWAPQFTDEEKTKRDPNYSLVALVMPGDIVFHYSKTKRGIVGYSIASGYAYEDVDTWGSQGSVEKAQNPFPRDIYKVDLSDFIEFDEPIGIDEVNNESEKIIKEIDSIKEATKGAAYAPFIFKNNKLEPPQGYLFKMPAKIAEILNIIEKKEDRATQINQISKRKEGVKRKGKRGTPNHKLNRLRELRGMDFATNYFKNEGWVVEDTSKTTVDLTCYKDGKTLYVEVKATGKDKMTSNVTLTKNEVILHKKESSSNALVIVSEIEIVKENDKEIAKGGVGHILYNWKPEDKHLTATQYDYIPQYHEFNDIEEF